MLLVGVSRGCIEDDSDLRINRQLAQPVHPLMGGRHTALAGHRQPLRCWVDADHRSEFEHIRTLEHLDHQISTNIA